MYVCIIILCHILVFRSANKQTNIFFAGVLCFIGLIANTSHYARIVSLLAVILSLLGYKTGFPLSRMTKNN